MISIRKEGKTMKNLKISFHYCPVNFFEPYENLTISIE